MTYQEFCSLMKFVSEDTENKIVRLYNENADVGGGKITTQEIDKIAEYQNTDFVQIMGLNQDIFEYFIKTYGHRLKNVEFFKNKAIKDLSMLGTLPNIEFINFYHNQHITKLWDMSQNKNLMGIALYDFTRLNSLDGIQNAPNLKHLVFGDMVWSTSSLVDIEPIRNLGIESFEFGGKKIENYDISIYKTMPNLRHLEFGFKFHTMDENAQILAHNPQVSGASLVPYHEWTCEGKKYIMISGKGTPNMLDPKKDADKIKRYTEKFHKLIEKYKNS